MPNEKKPPTPTTPYKKPIMTRRDLEAHIVANAWRDPAYRARLLKDPKGVVQEELHSVDSSINLPADLKVHVHEESQSSYHLVLPRNPKEISLSDVVGDDNLEALAPQTIAVLVAVVAVVAGNTVTVGNNLTNVNAVVNGNVAVNGNVVQSANAVG
jgi:hypothetical protein